MYNITAGLLLECKANISLAQGFDPGTLVGIVVGAAAGILLLVLVVTAISCYVWKEHTLRTYRIEVRTPPVSRCCTQFGYENVCVVCGICASVCVCCGD